MAESGDGCVTDGNAICHGQAFENKGRVTGVTEVTDYNGVTRHPPACIVTHTPWTLESVTVESQAIENAVEIE